MEMVGCMCSVALTNVSEGGGHCVCPSLIAGQAAIHSSILFLHFSYNQCAIRSHPVSEHTRYTRRVTERSKTSNSD